MRLWLLLIGAALACMAPRAARGDAQVELLGTWPAGDHVTLPDGQTYYLHLRYTSDVPVRIWVQPTFRGAAVKAGTNTSRIYPAGTGEALGWFFLFDAGARVDEVRIAAGDGMPGGTPLVAVVPVDVTAGAASAAAEPQPEWLTSLGAADKAAQDAAYRKFMDAPLDAGDIVLFNGFMLAVFALGVLAFAGPAWGLWRWRGGWRAVAAVPAVLMTFVVLRFIVDTARDPTSHNLWPFEIGIWGALSCVWMLIALIAHRLARARARG